MREVMKESPILLLDDVLSELDSNRKTYLLESIKDTQTIITCTGLDEFISKTFFADPTDVSDKSRKNCKGKLGGNYGYTKKWRIWS